jgi:hypothetical protein
MLEHCLISRRMQETRAEIEDVNDGGLLIGKRITSKAKSVVASLAKMHSMDKSVDYYNDKRHQHTCSERRRNRHSESSGPTGRWRQR